jgi:hypothetical protein
MSALGVHVHPEVVDRMIELYCDWRTSCEEVQSRYARFLDAPASDRAAAFTAYMAALDREESACDSYAELVRVIASRCTARSVRGRRRETPGR